MSQTTFLNDIHSWNQEDLAHRWQEALEHLTSYLQKSEDATLSSDILRTIYVTIIPVVPTSSLETSIFSTVCHKTCDVFISLLESAAFHAEQSLLHDVGLSDVVGISLQNCIEIVAGIDSCMDYLSAEACSGGIRFSHVVSLPNCVVTLIDRSYNHCKDSSRLYGSWFGAVSEKLAVLFKKVHHLQTSFGGLLERLDFSEVSDNDARNLCDALQCLSAVCDTASQLDVRVMVSLWKIISRLCCQHKEVLRTHVDMSAILSTLCDNMDSSCFRLVQPDESDSQPDVVETQNKVTKVVGFEMKVLVALVTDYVDWLGDCVRNIYRLVQRIQGLVLRLPGRPQLPDVCREEFVRHVSVGLEPLVSCLITNRDFATCLTGVKQPEHNCEVVRLILLTTVMRLLGTFDDDVRCRWIVPVINMEDEPRHNLLDAAFIAFSNCYVDLCVPVRLPGIMSSGKPLSDVSLYEATCSHICAFIATFTTRHFAVAERCLLSNVVGSSVHCSLLAADVWCFIARYGSSELCRDHIALLISVICRLRPSMLLSQSCHLVALIRRLVRLMSVEHQNELFACKSVDDLVYLFSLLPVSIVQSPTVRETLTDLLLPYCCQAVEDWSAVPVETHTVSEIPTLHRAVDCLAGLIESLNSDEHKDRAVECVRLLLRTVPPGGSTNCQQLARRVVASVIAVVARTLVTSVADGDLVVMGVSFCCGALQSTTSLLSCPRPTVRRSDAVRLSVIYLLSSLAKKVFPPSPDQSHILRLLARLFAQLLADDSLIVQQTAMETFARFAERTAHTSVVADSLAANDRVRETVVAFLSQLAAGRNGDSIVDIALLKAQNEALSTATVETLFPVADEEDSSSSDLPQPPAKKQKMCAEAAERSDDKFETELQEAIDSMTAGLHTVRCLRSSAATLPRKTVQQLTEICAEISTLIS